MAKKAIVMGATSGIGMEVAKLLAAKGWQVGIAGRRIERLQALISQGGITCLSANRRNFYRCSCPTSRTHR